MPFPQKVTDRLSQAPSRTPGGLRQLLLLSTLLFLLSAASYVGLKFGYKKLYLEPSIEASKKQLVEFSEKVPLEDQTKLISFYSQLINLKSLLASHVPFSPIFAWLETNTQINTYFKDFNFDKKNNTLSLSASSKSFNDMAEQILAFENQNDQVKKVEVSNISSKENVWQFNLDLSLSPGFLIQFRTLQSNSNSN